MQILTPHFPDSDLVSLDWGPWNLFYFSDYPGYCDGQPCWRTLDKVDKAPTERKL